MDELEKILQTEIIEVNRVIRLRIDKLFMKNNNLNIGDVVFFKLEKVIKNKKNK